MAEEKEKKKQWYGDSYMDELIFLLAGLFVLSAIIGRLSFLSAGFESSILGGWFYALINFFQGFWFIWKILAALLATSSIILGVYSVIKLKAVAEEEEKIYGTLPEETFLEHGEESSKKNSQWAKVQNLANSNNPSDWRLAIMEADIMLEGILRAAGYVGEGVGEMLKTVDRSDMLTLDSAWEAHKVRNRIAHSGHDFDLTEREARRVIALFKEVFTEFQII